MNIDICKTIVCGLILDFLLVGCSHFDKASKSEAKEDRQIEIISENPSSGTSDNNEKWSSKEINFKQKVAAFFFLTESVGWVVEGNKLRKTTDSGKTWANLTLPESERNYVSRILFSDDMKGWIVVTNNPDKTYTSNSISMVFATEDGGRNWSQLKQIEGANIDEIMMDGSGRFWIVGTEIYRPFKEDANRARSRLTCSKGLALRTGINDEVWEDVSPFINDFIEARGPEGCKNESFAGIDFTGSNVVLVLATSGLLIESSDGGSTWHNHSKKIIEETGIKNFGVFPDGTLWVLSSARSIDQSGTRFLSDSAEGRFIFDFSDKFLTGLESSPKHDLIAIGVKIIADAKNGEFTDEAVIVKSNNRGRTWNEIYTSQNSEAIVSLKVVNDNVIWALTNRNNLIHLQNGTPASSPQ